LCALRTAESRAPCRSSLLSSSLPATFPSLRWKCWKHWTTYCGAPMARAGKGTYSCAPRRRTAFCLLLFCWSRPIDTAGGACTIQVGTYFHIRNGSGAKC
jgi:hypothetical protein